MLVNYVLLFFFQAEDGIRDLVRSRGLGDVYKRQVALHVLFRLHDDFADFAGGKITAVAIDDPDRDAAHRAAAGPHPGVTVRVMVLGRQVGDGAGRFGEAVDLGEIALEGGDRRTEEVEWDR